MRFHLNQKKPPELATFPYPDMRQFMCHSKHLCGFTIGIIDEYKRVKIINKNKSPAFINTNGAMGIIVYNTIL